MKAACTLGLFATLVCLAAPPSGAAARADAIVVPSFKSSSDKETKDFVARVGKAIVQAARARPEEVELDRYEYNKPAPGRHELLMKVNYTGFLGKRLKKKYTATITVRIDSSDRERWEVLKIDYKDNNTLSLRKPNETRIQKLIPRFNK